MKHFYPMFSIEDPLTEKEIAVEPNGPDYEARWVDTREELTEEEYERLEDLLTEANRDFHLEMDKRSQENYHIRTYHEAKGEELI